MLRIGLTGGIGSGKSTVAALLADRGAVVVDADRIAREVVEPGTPGLAAVAEEFGPEVLTDDGRLDRTALGAVVFADEDARRRLEAILHPLIRARSAEIEAAAGPGVLVVHDIPLLVESGQAELFDAVLVVDVPVPTQVERMTGDRGWTREQAQARVAAQADRETRLRAATHVIDNTGTRDDLRERVTEVVEELVSTGSPRS